MKSGSCEGVNIIKGNSFLINIPMSNVALMNETNKFSFI